LGRRPKLKGEDPPVPGPGEKTEAAPNWPPQKCKRRPKTALRKKWCLWVNKKWLKERTDNDVLVSRNRKDLPKIDQKKNLEGRGETPGGKKKRGLKKPVALGRVTEKKRNVAQ